MKKYILLILIALSALSSCQKEGNADNGEDNGPVVPDDGLVEKTIIVSNVTTKTLFDGLLTEDGMVVMKWCAEDALAVYDGTAVRRFAMVSEPQETQAVFKGRISPQAQVLNAYYPYREDLSSPLSLTQYVSAEGGMTDGTVYAAGQVDTDDRLDLRVTPAFLKFSVNSGLNIKSVKMGGTAQNDIFGGNTIIISCKDGSALPTGVDMYAVLPSGYLESGYTVTFIAADGTETVQGTDGYVEWESGKVYDVQNEFAPPPSADYYADYVDGADVIIAGKAYNKAQYGNPVLIEKGQTTTITSNGVYFIEPGAMVEYNPTSSMKKMVVIGRDPSQRSAMLQKTHFKMDTQGELALLNLDLESSGLTGSTYLFNIYSSNTPQRVAMDNCRINFSNKNFMYHAKETWVSEVLFHNCDVKLSYSSTNDLWLFNVDSKAPHVSIMEFKNNVFWHTGALASGKGFRVTNGSAIAIDNFKFVGNTFVNLPTRKNQESYVSANINKAEVKNNLCYISGQLVDGAFFQQTPADATVSDNVSYTGNEFKFIFNSTETSEVLSESPFASMNLETGDFVKKDGFRKYGASR